MKLPGKEFCYDSGDVKEIELPIRHLSGILGYATVLNVLPHYGRTGLSKGEVGKEPSYQISSSRMEGEHLWPTDRP